MPNDDNKLRPVEIIGIRDPEGDSVQVTVTGITQDEPTSGLREGDSGPDAVGVGTSYAWLRGQCDLGAVDKPGNGRVYTVAFKATDSLGACATGKVRVTVPYGSPYSSRVIDDGQKFDSTKSTDLQANAKGEARKPVKG